MRDLIQARNVLLECHSETSITREKLFVARELLQGDYDKIFQIDDMINGLNSVVNRGNKLLSQWSCDGMHHVLDDDSGNKIVREKKTKKGVK